MSEEGKRISAVTDTYEHDHICPYKGVQVELTNVVAMDKGYIISTHPRPVCPYTWGELRIVHTTLLFKDGTTADF